MNSHLTMIENLVGIMQLRESGHGAMVPAEFRDYDDETLAKMLCSLAVTHLDSVSGTEGDG